MTRNTRYTMDDPNGTMFQELVVYPTLAPQLARTQNRHLPQAANTAAPVGASQVATAAAGLVANAGMFWFIFDRAEC